jgi:GT2 family glycosyltransferase
MTVAEPPLLPLQAPVAVTDVDVAPWPPGSPADAVAPGPGTVLALVRVHSQPVGTVVVRAGGREMTSAELADAVHASLGGQIDAHLRRDELAPVGDDGSPPLCLRRRAEVLSAAPFITVIVATRDRTASLARCLDSVLAVEYPSFEVVVVDNDPTSNATAALVESTYAARGVRYVREDHRGLAAAHNRGLEVSGGAVLAFTDDDVVVDRHWLAALAEAFVMTDRVGAVSGLIQPGELRTAAQVLLERHGSFAKGYKPRIYDTGVHRPADPRFPLATGQCGSGANMAFDADCLRRLGGFDAALGAGSPARGGDDLAAFFGVLTAGHRLVYQPAAVVRHWHRDNDEALTSQAYGYGVGLGAYLTGAVLRHPGVAVATAVSSVRSGRGPGRTGAGWQSQRYAGWPQGAARLGRRGAMVGPLAYATSRWRARGGRGRA